jgi:RNA polymerase sigma factor (sigma-70 family)
MLGAALGAGNRKTKGLLPLCLPAAEHATPSVQFMVPQAIVQQESVTDDELMSRVRDGDVQALAPLFERHHVALLNFYLRTTGNRASSEDLVQDVFLRILKYRRTYRPGSRFLTWMYHIARHVGVDHLRKRHGEIEWDDAYSAPTLPGDPAELAQHRRWLALALRRLPDDKREVLVLSRFQGLRYEAIGQLLDCEPGAVKVRVHRAMRELRECFRRISQEKIAKGTKQ